MTSSFHPVVFARPVRGAGGAVSPSDMLGQFAFSATLAIQDITGDVTSGQSAERMAVRLAGSAESDAYLIALCTTPPGPRPTGAFGLPTIPSTGTGPSLDVDTWLLVSIPLLEDLRVLEANVVLDASIAPLPHEPLIDEHLDPWRAALSLVDRISVELDRPILQLWVTHELDRLREADLLRSAGYSPAYTEIQAKLDLLRVSEATEAEIAYDMVFPADVQEGMAAIYTTASAELPRGELELDTIAWSQLRISQAAGRLADRGGEQITAYIVRDGSVVAFSEVMRYTGAEQSVVELGATFVDKHWRGEGLGRATMMTALAAAMRRWPGVEIGYTSYPDSAAAIAHLNCELGEEIISATSAWHKH